MAIPSSMETGGTGAATVQPYGVASNSVMARVALQPFLIWSQNLSRPTPKGETTPMPVIATEGVVMCTTVESDLRMTDVRHTKRAEHEQTHAPPPSVACNR